VDFRWIEWNIEHLALHGVDPEEAEEVVRAASAPYPKRIADHKLLVWGAGRGGRLLQVIFVLDEDQTAFVIHARQLTNREKSILRRKRR
jgi:uncharacterized DUF497 family protein